MISAGEGGEGRLRGEEMCGVGRDGEGWGREIEGWRWEGSGVSKFGSSKTLL